MKEYFRNTDLNLTFSHWKSEFENKYIVFPPLTKLNSPLFGFHFTSKDTLNRMDFQLIEKNDKLIFHDIHSNNLYYFEIDENDKNKFYFTGENNERESWIRQPMKSTSEWLK